jgi:transposase
MKGKSKAPEVSNPDPEARRRAAAVLEVLGGLSTPLSAAEASGISLARYYSLEKRALEGLVAACATPSRRGRRQAPERELDALRERAKRLEREASRNLAMLRAAQKAAGWSLSSAKADKKSSVKNRKGRRKPVARALTAAEVLRGVIPVSATS